MKIIIHRLSCVLPILATLVLASCNKDDGQIARLQDELRSLGDQQNLSQSELSRLKSQLNSLGKERDTLKAEKATLEADLESARKMLDQMQKDFKTYREQYKLGMKTKAPGLPLGDFMVDGKSYQKVKVLEATDELLSILHGSGTSKFPWSSVPDNICRLFGHEKPGEFPVITFAFATTGSQEPSLKERIEQHDAHMVELQKEISALQSELKILGKSETDARKALATAKYKKLETVKIESARNAYSAQRIQIEARLRSLKKSQAEFIKQDPRKKKTL